jgi:branched-subunit amino acid aminotransferase/4-amino-4-deoxychorismate lyase
VRADDAGVPLTASGCAIVEEMLVSEGMIVRLCDHIDRLICAAAGLSLPLPLKPEELRDVCKHIVAANADGPRSALYVTLSFGVYLARSRRLSPLTAVAPALVVHSHSLAAVPPSHLTDGISLFPAADNRPTLSHPDELSAPYVSSSQLPEVLALHKAISNGCEEAALFDVSTTPATFTSTCLGNLFVVKFGICYTPPATGKVPDGVMRRFVLDACREKGIEAREVSIPMAFLTSAAEVFCTSNLDEVLPVRSVGQTTIGTEGGTPGPVTSKVMMAVKSLKDKQRESICFRSERVQRLPTGNENPNLPAQQKHQRPLLEAAAAAAAAHRRKQAPPEAGDSVLPNLKKARPHLNTDSQSSNDVSKSDDA